MTIHIKQLHLTDQSVSDGVTRLDYRVDLGDRFYDVFIQGREVVKRHGMEPALPLGLLAGMRLGRAIHVEGALSRTYLNGVKQVVGYYSNHFDQLNNVDITCDELVDGLHIKSERIASFFSGGVDSFFTLMKYQNRLTDIIYIYGFDVRLDDWSRRAAISSMGSAVASEMGLNFIEVESNFGKVIQDFGSWAEHGHGMALASVARSLAGNIGEVIIPGSDPLVSKVPWGTRPETDPLYSDNSLAVIHDACDAERMDKVERLAREPLALKHLRVCWENIDGAYNCCRCEKCLRTMCTLDALGVLEMAGSFHLPLTSKAVANALLLLPSMRVYPRENIKLYERQGKSDSPIIKALLKQQSRPIWLALWYAKWRKRRTRWARHARRLFKTGINQ